MVNTIWADPVLRRNYQIWVFSYPSGYPIPYSALLLRRELDALNKALPNHRPMILVGHSMGGIISRFMITDTNGDKVWRILFGKPPAQTSLSPENKALLREALVFKPRPDVACVIFISTPHRGSVIAQNAVGRIASRIMRTPHTFVALGSADSTSIRRSGGPSGHETETDAKQHRHPLRRTILWSKSWIPFHWQKAFPLARSSATADAEIRPTAATVSYPLGARISAEPNPRRLLGRSRRKSESRRDRRGR